MLSLLAAIFFGLCLLAAASDAHRLTIPNWINAALAGTAIAALAVSGLSLEQMGLHLLCGATGFAIAYLLWTFSIIGGGDAKMLPGVLVWMGPGAALYFTQWTALAGGLIVLVMLMVRASVPLVLVPQLIRQPFETRQVPYGIAIAAGAFAAAPESALVSPVLRMLPPIF